jgi:filamin
LNFNLDNQSVNFSGDGLYQAQVNLLNSFVIDAHSACLSNDDIEIITYPTNTSTCPMQIINNQNGTWTVNYIPNEIGLIQMDIFLQKKLINNHPFKVNIFDINQIHISNFKDGLVDQLVQFDIDTSKAGIGQLEIVVQDGDVPCEAIAHGSSRFHVTFLPQKCGLYKIDIRFNRLTIPGKLFYFQKRKSFFFY